MNNDKLSLMNEKNAVLRSVENKSVSFKQFEVEKKLFCKTYIQLLHGRNHPDEELNDWGFDGPTLGPIEWIHITYNSTINIKFEGEDNPTDICNTEEDGICLTPDMFYYDGKYYGDWSIVKYSEEME